MCSEQAAGRQRTSGSGPGELVSSGSGQPVSEHQEHLSYVSVSVSTLQTTEAWSVLTWPLLLPMSFTLEPSSALGFLLNQEGILFHFLWNNQTFSPDNIYQVVVTMLDLYI